MGFGYVSSLNVNEFHLQNTMQLINRNELCHRWPGPYDVICICRVLAGIQVPSEEHPQFEDFLEKLHYVYYQETDNPAVQTFFRA